MEDISQLKWLSHCNALMHTSVTVSTLKQTHYKTSEK